jgi:hypothetical protein
VNESSIGSPIGVLALDAVSFMQQFRSTSFKVLFEWLGSWWDSSQVLREKERRSEFRFGDARATQSSLADSLNP